MADIIKLPYRYITGLTKQQQHEIWRDFEAVAQHASGAASVYDAIIDPILTTSVPASHVYKNLTDLVAHEVPPGISSGVAFNVGLVPRGASATCTEPGPINISTWPALNLVSIGSMAADLANTGMPAFWWVMPAITGPAGAVMLRGVHVPSSGAMTIFGSGNILVVQDCWFGSGMTIGSGPFVGINSFFGTSKLTLSTTDSVELFNCVWVGTPSATTFALLRVMGGFINGSLITSGTGGVFVACQIQGTVQIGNTGGAFVNNLGQANSAGVVVELLAGVNTAELRGAWSRLILRGSGHRADVLLVQSSGNANPYISLIGCTDSLVTADVSSPSAGGQAYTIDAASARSLIVLGGSHHANFSVASTNAGTNCLVIDELGAPAGPPTGAAGGSLAGTYPNPTFAGRDPSVDALNKDMLPGSNLGLAEGPMGVQVYGHASESALSQTTDLSGTWPYFQVTGIAGKKVSATAPGDGDILNYVTGFNVGWINSTRESSSLATKDFAKDFMLMGG